MATKTKTKGSKSSVKTKAKAATKTAKASAPKVSREDSAAAKAKREADAEARRESRRELHESRIADVMRLRDDEERDWDEITETMELDSGRCRQYYMIGRLKSKDHYKGSDDEIAALIVEGRDEQDLAWGELVARCFRSRGWSQAKVKAMYEATTGRSSNQGYEAVQRRSGTATAPTKTAKKGPNKTEKAVTKAKAGAKRRNPSKG